VRARVRVRLCVYVYLQRAQSNEEFEKKVFVSARERIQKSETLRKHTLRMKERVAWETLALRFSYASIFDSLLLQVRVVTDC